MDTELTHDEQLELYYRMLRIRRFEEAAIKLQKRGEITGAIHASIGQEATIVGACAALRSDDFMAGTHRSHGHPIAKGAELAPLMAELLGRATGVCRGKGGSMHLADFSVGSVGESSIVGGGIPIATGAAWSAQVRSSGQVSLCFFGDGAANQGTFHESLNMAAVWKLPVVYVCENNRYAATTPAEQVTAGGSVAGRSVAYGMPGVVVDGQDVLAVHRSVRAAVERAREGEGPSLVECLTYRFREHAEGLPISGSYRTPGELDDWMATKDPIVVFGHHLTDHEIAYPAVIEALCQQVDTEVAEAVAEALAAPWPEPPDAFTDVFATPLVPTSPAGVPLATGGGDGRE